MDEVHRLQYSTLRIELEDPSSREARWCLERYFEELDERFESGFEAGKSTVSDHAELQPPDGVFLVGRLDGRAVACGAVKRVSPEVGYIKRMWVDRSVRGLGLGRRLLEALEQAAESLGCGTVQLETNEVLEEAIRLYRSAGYGEVAAFNDEHYAHHWFEKRLARE